EPKNVGELLAPVFEKNDRLSKPKPPLKQPSFVHDILAGSNFSIGLLIFSGHYQECKAGAVQHFRRAVRGGDARCRDRVELVHWEIQTIAQEIPEFAPYNGAAVANDHVGARVPTLR